jgi:general secretion pathway protein G
MSDKNSCIKLEIKKNQNVVSIDVQVDSSKDTTICKKIRDSGLVSKVYEVY